MMKYIVKDAIWRGVNFFDNIYKIFFTKNFFLKELASYTNYISENLYHSGPVFNFDAKLYAQIQEKVCASNTSSLIAGGCFTNASSSVDVFIFSNIDSTRQNIENVELLNLLNSDIREQVHNETQNTLKCCPPTIFTTEVLGKPVKIWVMYQWVKQFPSLLSHFQLEPAKICFVDGKFHLSKWFIEGGNIVVEDTLPTSEYVQKYLNRGFSENQSTGWENNQLSIFRIC